MRKWNVMILLVSLICLSFAPITVLAESDSEYDTNEAAWARASEWATSELEKADKLGLIPDSLRGEDMTKQITRAEFAAVAVKVYENLSGIKAIPVLNNPFTDTNDVEVLKAYNLNIAEGHSAEQFAPNAILNREQAATMLTRVFKRVTLTGWTLASDNEFKLTYKKPTPFADDAKISDWAKESVYYMAANGIIEGVGDNKFSPRATTPAEEAQNYANATREQALAIAVRMAEKLANSDGAPHHTTDPGDNGDDTSMVEVTFAEEYLLGASIDELTEDSVNMGIDEVIVNADRSVTFRMTKSRHKEIVDEMKREIYEWMDATVNAINSVSKITINEAFTELRVSANESEFTTKGDIMNFIGISFQAAYLQMFDLVKLADVQFKILYINEDTGVTFNSDELEVVH